MLSELREIYNKLQGCREELFSMYSRLNPQKNQKSKEQILSAQLEVMQALGKLDELIKKIEKTKKGGV